MRKEGSDPFKGAAAFIDTAQFLAGGWQFGSITSANITPDKNGQPAGLMFEEFEHLLRTAPGRREILIATIEVALRGETVVA
jgi:hypothetical protein